MAKAVRVGDQTAHGVPLTGSGSPDVLINNKPAWRAIPAGVGDGLEKASKAAKKMVDKPLFMPPEILADLVEVEVGMMLSAASAAKDGNSAAAGAVQGAFAALKATNVALTAT